MDAAVEFKRRMAGISIFGIVECKFSHWQETYSIILFSIYKDSEICLYCAILLFCLAISLRMESHRESFLYS